MIHWNLFDAQNTTQNTRLYEAMRYRTLLQLEESGVEKLRVYADHKGIATIGIGLNLREIANVDAERKRGQYRMALT